MMIGCRGRWERWCYVHEALSYCVSRHFSLHVTKLPDHAEGTDLNRLLVDVSIGRQWEQDALVKPGGMMSYSKDGWEGNSRRKGSNYTYA